MMVERRSSKDDLRAHGAPVLSLSAPLGRRELAEAPVVRVLEPVGR